MLRLIDVHTYYWESYILKGVSIDLEEGSVVAFLGRNGMGKTTAIRSIVGLTPPETRNNPVQRKRYHPFTASEDCTNGHRIGSAG